MSSGLIAVLILGAGLLAAVLLGRGKRSGQGGMPGRARGADALTRACHGNREQAERLEALEQKRAGGKLSSRAARQRAAERMKRDRG